MEAGAMRSTIRSWVIGILLAWIVVFAASFIVPIFVPPTGEFYMRGLNRLNYWFGLQVAAFAIAIAACVSAHLWRAGISHRLVWLSRVPLLVTVAEILAILWLIRGSSFSPL
jgi:hypothetical protein